MHRSLHFKLPAAIYALPSGCSNACDSLTLYYWGFWKMPRKMALSPAALLLALAVGAAAQQSVSLPSGRALRTKKAKCDGVGSWTELAPATISC